MRRGRYLQRWEPFGDLWSLHENLDKLFFGPHRGKEEEEERAMWSPTMDVCEEKDAIKVYVDLPGINKKDVTINVENNVLTVKGERKFEEEEKKKDYYRIERAYGTFNRSFALPANVDPNNINAQMKDGILTINIPKKPEAKPKEIEIH